MEWGLGKAGTKKPPALQRGRAGRISVCCADRKTWRNDIEDTLPLPLKVLDE